MSRRVKIGAYALDCRGSILHFAPGLVEWYQLKPMFQDIELQMLGMVEIRIVGPVGQPRYHGRMYWDPYYLYQDFGRVIDERD